MTYELAKQLKDAGFPQNVDSMVYGEDGVDFRFLIYRGIGWHRTYDSSIVETVEELREKPVKDWYGKGRASIYFSKTYLESEEGKELTVYVPTISELIEACGDRFNNLYLMNVGTHGEDKWYCCDRKLSNHCFGKTPEEAVANLWLALNKK